MRIAFVVNDIRTEWADYTTTHLARVALARGHETYHLSVGDFSLGPNEDFHVTARRPPRHNYRSPHTLLRDLQSDASVVERVPIEAFDVVLLRNDPAEDLVERPWARLAGVNFGRLCVGRNVMVFNDPDGLAHAVNKIYLHAFPSEIRPRSIVTRNRDEIRAFVHESPQGAVLKPIAGSGGARVFLVEEQDRRNINQIIDAVLADGYALAQEYLPEAESGDTRLFLLNGEIMESHGKIAAVRRECQEGDLRSNLSAGGVARPGQITDAMRRIADAVRPRLVRDGMFLVGVDIVGDKVLEINVFSPGGLNAAEDFTGIDFFAVVIAALERKVELKSASPGAFSNVELATRY
ncbi:MAG: glutathione synthetase [Gammaproteobacteria bacterium]|nr:glutathione synthetase [Gammaproteobacteria bacterium]